MLNVENLSESYITDHANNPTDDQYDEDNDENGKLVRLAASS